MSIQHLQHGLALAGLELDDASRETPVDEQSLASGYGVRAYDRMHRPQKIRVISVACLGPIAMRLGAVVDRCHMLQRALLRRR